VTQNRVYKTVLSETHSLFSLLENYCHESKNLYNYANYILRNRYREKDFELFNFYKLRKFIQSDLSEGNPWRRQATTHIGAETLRTLINSWQSYFSSLKSYSNAPEKFKAMPKQPGYLPKNGTFQMVLDTDNFKFDGATVRFPKCFKGLQVPFDKAAKVYQVRVVPKYNHLIAEVVYRVESRSIAEDNGRYLSLDLGVCNFVAITSNVAGFQSLVVNGKGLQSTNQFYNKQKAHYQELADRLHQGNATNRLNAITWKRNQRVYDFLHKASRYVADLAKEQNISRVICGYNTDWKHEANLGRLTNQKFVQIPYLKFVSLLRYKLADNGIELTLPEESYTSKTSFLDGEHPEKRLKYAGRRRHRGLFICGDGRSVNADVNAAYQTMKKVIPNAYSNGIEGFSLHPVRVNLASVLTSKKAYSPQAQ